jgi:DNA-binding phage protein
MKTLERERKQQLIELAIEEYLNSSETQRSLTKIGEKYGVHRNTLSKTLKNRGYEVINYQNQVRIDENVFDEIDTEEKAY